MKKNIWRAIMEASFIVFLIYSNVLMGQFERSGTGQEGVWFVHLRTFLPLPILKSL
jgi:hypothetical protein